MERHLDSTMELRATQRTSEQRFVLPTKPLSITDAINRMALATGCFNRACAGSGADYNGHRIEVRFNEHRGYWVAEYHWCDRIVVARGDLARCLSEARSTYESQGRGASVEVIARNEDEAAICITRGYIPADQEDIRWRDWRFDEVGHALDMERRGFGAYTAHLIAATSRDDYVALTQDGLLSSPIASAMHRRSAAQVGSAT